MLKDLLDKSYDLVLKGFSKKKQMEILNKESPSIFGWGFYYALNQKKRNTPNTFPKIAQSGTIMGSMVSFSG